MISFIILSVWLSAHPGYTLATRPEAVSQVYRSQMHLHAHEVIQRDQLRGDCK